MMKKRYTFLLFLILLTRPTLAFNYAKANNLNAADKDYQILHEIEMKIQKVTEYNNINTIKNDSVDILSEQHRQLGSELWFKYPNDKRKFIWLDQTLSFGILHINYWEKGIDSTSNYFNGGNYSAEVEVSEIKDWKSKFNLMKAEIELYNSHSIDKIDVSNIILKYFKNELNLCRNSIYRQNFNINSSHIGILTQNLIDSLDSTFDIPGRLSSVIYMLDYNLVSRSKSIGIDYQQLLSLLTTLKIRNPKLENWRKHKIAILSLMNTPLNITFTDITGEAFSTLQNNRKLILIDIWTTYCTSCVARMSYLKELHRKLSTHGFEIISLCAQSIDEITAHKKTFWKDFFDNSEYRWKWVIGGSLKDSASLSTKLWNMYGFMGVPQYILIDKTGRLLMYNNEIINEDITKILEKLIFEDYQ